MIKKNIKIYYTQFNDQLKDQVYNHYLNQLPVSMQEKNIKYRRWQDRHSHLFGKILLLYGLKKLGFTRNILERINYNQNLRPYIDGDLDFNISHSGEYVVCAMGESVRLGVDVEEIKQINFGDFTQVMTLEQCQNIRQSIDPIRSFFKYWTIKESVIKADNRGLSIPLLDLHVNNNRVCYDDKTWFLKNLFFNKKYCATLAINEEDVTIEQKYINFYK